MTGNFLIRKSFFTVLACGVLLTCYADAQELVPVNSRREVGWGNSAGELPAPVNMSQEDEYQFPEPQSQELPKYTGGPARKSEVITQRYPDGKPQVTRQVMQDPDGNFLNHGPWKLFSRRGQVMAEGEFKEGLMDGTWQRWHPADSPGLFKEAPFSMFQGPFLSIATFSAGKLDGTWTIFDRFRRKIFEMTYSAESGMAGHPGTCQIAPQCGRSISGRDNSTDNWSNTIGKTRKRVMQRLTRGRS